MSKPNTSSSGTRILRVLKALRGHALNGVSNGELASALGESRRISIGRSIPLSKKDWP
jgi:hypothetical protein